MRRLLAVFASCLLAVSAAQPVRAQDDLEARITAQRIAADEAGARRTAGLPAVEAARGKSRQLAQAVTDLKLAFSKAEVVAKDLEGKLPGLKDAATKAAEAKTAAEAESAAAAKAAEEAKGKDNEKDLADKAKAAADKLAAAAKAAEEAQKAATDAEAQLASSKEIVAAHPEKLKAAEAEVTAFVAPLQQAEEAFAALTAEHVAKQRELEQTLIGAGRLVSFANQVAPIFSQRCVACHNARTAKGRFNMENYANVMKGGESGDAVVAGKPDDSLVFSMCADGSMPKDADPLTPEQTALIKKWIETGATLDAGLNPSAMLITIIPKPVQPNPPESYRVPVPIMAVAFSPDGNLVASSGYREVILWNAADGALVRRITNLAERPHDIRFTADGAQIAVAAGTPGQLGEVKLFNVADGALLADFFTTDDEVFACAFSPDGTRLAAACADRSVRVFDVATRKQQLQVEDHADWVMDVAWSPDGKLLATASRDKTSKVFNSTSGESQTTFNTHQQPVFGVAFSPDGAQVATSGRDNRIRTWNPADGKQIREIGGFGGEVFRISVQPDGTIFSGCSDKQVRLHKLADGAVVRAFPGHTDWVYSVSAHPASKRVASGSHDGEIRIWNIEDGKGIVTFLAAPGYKTPVAAK